MTPPLFIAVAVLLLCIALYVTIRRNRHGGLAGGNRSFTPPRTQASIGVGRVISVDEVAKHSSENDFWLIIAGKVYDFSEYLPYHPGGESMLRNAGKDGTDGFSGPQHPDRVWQMVCFALTSMSTLLAIA